MDIFLADESRTVLFAEDLALALAPGDLICLSGDLGAGKSTLARAVIRAIADDEELEVPSPTFTLVQSYDLRLPVAHFDLYRIASSDELDELGLDEALASGVALVEWPERAGDRLPAGRVTIAISGSGDSRTLRITGPEDFMARLDRSRRARAFLDRSGHAGARRRFLQGDASFRAYESVGNGEVLLMNAPRRPDGPPVRDGLPYSRIAHLAEDVAPFVAVAGWLRGKGLSAPEIPAIDYDDGFLLVENLGMETALDPEGAPDPERYRAAIDCLAAMHGPTPPAALPLPDRPDYEVPAYDRRALQIEVELLIDWYLPWRRNEAVHTSERNAYVDLWQGLFGRLETVEKALVLRDYHSPNLMWCAGREGIRRVGLIDFQDALIGPSAYDVASLVQDARVTVPDDLAVELLARYEAARLAADPGFDLETFRATYAIMAAQRASKILGIFVRLDRRDGKPAYLRHLPRMERYLTTSLRHEALAPLRAWFAAAGIAQSAT
jgi:ATPase, YjeE family